MTKIKICGITSEEDAHEASRLGVDMLGFVFYEKSSRFVGLERAATIIRKLPKEIAKVGVFVNEEEENVLKAATRCGLTMVQLHGDESPGYCARLKKAIKVIKAFRIKDARDCADIDTYDADLYLLDSYVEGKKGGTGRAFDWGIVSGSRFGRPLLVSGGLTSENVAEAIQAVSPYGVDVSSGVEFQPGKKDVTRMREFVNAVRKAVSHVA